MVMPGRVIDLPVRSDPVLKPRETNRSSSHFQHRVRHAKAAGGAPVRTKSGSFHKGKTGIKLNQQQRPVRGQENVSPATTKVLSQTEKKKV